MQRPWQDPRTNWSSWLGQFRYMDQDQTLASWHGRQLSTVSAAIGAGLTWDGPHAETSTCVVIITAEMMMLIQTFFLP